MTFKLEIELGNDTMQTAFHVARALTREVAPALRDYYIRDRPIGPREFVPGASGVIRDGEGKRVGSGEAS